MYASECSDMNIRRIIGFLLILGVGAAIFHLGSSRYGTGWNAAATHSIEALIAHDPGFLQDMYHLKNQPPDPEALNKEVIENVHLQIRRIENDLKRKDLKTIHAHVTMDVSPEFFEKEPTLPASRHAEGDYVFYAARTFWPSPIMFLPSAIRVDTSWQRE